MQQYLYQLRPTRPEMLTAGPTPEESAAITRHFEYLKGLTAQGVVLLAGRTLNTDESSFGLVVFREDDDASARRIMDGDPAVQAGVMSARLFPYRVALKADDRFWSL
jgi:uncharacterized protein YciI